jgi:hypothetical protein
MKIAFLPNFSSRADFEKVKPEKCRTCEGTNRVPEQV